MFPLPDYVDVDDGGDNLLLLLSLSSSPSPSLSSS
jgi:hypothetical protein